MASNDQIRNRKKNKGLGIESKIPSTEESENKEKDHLTTFIELYPKLLPDTSSYYLTRIILIRFLAFIYGNYLD